MIFYGIWLYLLYFLARKVASVYSIKMLQSKMIFLLSGSKPFYGLLLVKQGILRLYFQKCSIEINRLWRVHFNLTDVIWILKVLVCYENHKGNCSERYLCLHWGVNNIFSSIVLEII